MQKRTRKGGRMKEDLLKIINHYGVMPQLKYFQSEVFELNEAIIRYEEFNNHIGDLEVYDIDETELKKEHITEEIADVMVMLKQFQYYYGIEDKEIEEVMKYKIERQLKRIKNENKSNNN
jgi:NTP pyrophosphatase (non-canonical NTP hydrolase)